MELLETHLGTGVMNLKLPQSYGLTQNTEMAAFDLEVPDVGCITELCIRRDSSGSCVLW